MTVYSFYVFSPSCTCIYYQPWHLPSPVSSSSGSGPSASTPPQPASQIRPHSLPSAPTTGPSSSSAATARHHSVPTTPYSALAARAPKPGPDVLPAVSRLVSPMMEGEDRTSEGKRGGRPEDRFSSLSSGTTVALGGRSPLPGQTQFHLQGGYGSSGTPLPASKQDDDSEGKGKGLSFDEECKLIYGVVFSLRTMIKKLNGGRSDPFLAYSTSTYKLHLLNTPTNYTFILITSPNVDNLRYVLRQIYSTAFLEYVIRNPLVKLWQRKPELPERSKKKKHSTALENGERGVDNEMFRQAVDKFIRGLSCFD